MAAAAGDGSWLPALVGPTATGKSEVAREVARRRGAAGEGVEIVAVDAFTVYRGMDIGTAKPDPAARHEIAHHLVDVLDPWEDVSVAWFQERARAAIDDVRGRAAVPLLAGGSGLYFRAVVDDLRFPPTDPHVRARIRARYADDPPAAHRALAEVDPGAAAKIDAHNLRRSVRALEVIELTGQRFSAFDDAFDEYVSIYPGLDVRGVAVEDEELRRRIDERAWRMVERGLVDEAEGLRDLGRPLSRSAAQAIGYREAFAVLDGELAEEELASAIAQRTWRYAKRQRSWFSRDTRSGWAPAGAIVAAWSP
jgi:tRNA dimethylallyltransferase